MINKLLRKDQVRLGLLGLGLILLFLIIVEIGFNLWIRNALYHSLLEQEDRSSEIQAKLDWMSLLDLSQGKVNNVSLQARNCQVNQLHFSKLNVDSKGFVLDLSGLLYQKRLNFRSINPTEVNAVITAKALADYLKLNYPEFKPDVTIAPEKIRFIGEATVLDNQVEVVLEGNLAPSAEKTVRFYPDVLMLSGRKVPRYFLEFVSTQIPLDFSLLEHWPLRITRFQLGKEQLTISFREMNL